MSKGTLLLISGFFGAGKTTLAKHLVQKDSSFAYLKTYTTRPRREDDSDFEYIFLSFKEYESLRSKSQNWDHMDNASLPHLYGADVSEANMGLNKGLNLVCCIPPSLETYNQMKNLYKGRIVLIWLDTPLSIANKRLKDSQIDGRMKRLGHVLQNESSTILLRDATYFTFTPHNCLTRDLEAFIELVREIQEKNS